MNNFPPCFLWLQLYFLFIWASRAKQSNKHSYHIRLHCQWQGAPITSTNHNCEVNTISLTHSPHYIKHVLLHALTACLLVKTGSDLYEGLSCLKQRQLYTVGVHTLGNRCTMLRNKRWNAYSICQHPLLVVTKKHTLKTPSPQKQHRGAMRAEMDLFLYGCHAASAKRAADDGDAPDE